MTSFSSLRGINIFCARIMNKTRHSLEQSCSFGRYARIRIVLACGKLLHDCVISLTGDDWVYKKITKG